jgi:hypothetical protein
MTDKWDDSRCWGALQGLLLGIAVLHGQQPVAAWMGSLQWTDKMYVSIGGAILYTISFIGMMLRRRGFLWINLIGPGAGLSFILIGYVLNLTGLLESTVRPDVFQIAGGIPQVAAFILSICLLRRKQ